MKKKYIFKAFLITFLLICAYSAGFLWLKRKYHCDNKTKIDISYMLNMYSSPGYYCNLVNESVIEQDEKAIRELSLLSFADGGTYVHGAILIQIVQEIGEEKYLKAML